MSSSLTPQSPLMQPVSWQGQTYFTSHYFHTQYLVNSPYAGKYRRHADFLRIVRSIEAYDIYINQQDIVELTFDRIKTEVTQDLRQWHPLFQAVGYRILVLLNATAQVALSHHLDDEISKQISVATNTHVGRQQAQKVNTGPTTIELASRDSIALLSVAQAFGTPLHIAQQETVKMIAATHGVDFRPFLLAAPAQQTILPEEEMLEPTDLAKRFGLPSGQVVNILLEEIGWQTKQPGGWEPTPQGEPYANRHAWIARQGTKSGYNWKWNVTKVRQAFVQRGALVA